MTEYDLIPILGQYLDPHMVLALLEFLSTKDVHDKADILQARLELLNKTRMLDYAIDVAQQLNLQDTTEELIKKRSDIIEQWNSIQGEGTSQFVQKILADTNAVTEIGNMRDQKSVMEYLKEKHGMKPEMIDSLVKLGKFRYECGNYQEVAVLLHFYLMVAPPNDKNYGNILWGKLASELLSQNWDSALEDLNKLRDYIESNASLSSLQMLQQRTWLIHWSLFIFFNHTKGKDLLIDLFLYKPNYLNAIQTMCPHILRYLATAVITNRGRRNALKDLVKVIQQECYTYRDPVTEFVENLYIKFDFEAARKKLGECQSVLATDFFIVGSLHDFVENARLMMFETFCRIHQCISISMLAEKLNMNVEEAEGWVVNLIRNARLEAKLDSKLGHIVMEIQPASPYSQIIEKMDSLAVRSEALHALIERKIKGRGHEIRWIMNDV